MTPLLRLPLLHDTLLRGQWLQNTIRARCESTAMLKCLHHLRFTFTATNKVSSNPPQLDTKLIIHTNVIKGLQTRAFRKL